MVPPLAETGGSKKIKNDTNEPSKSLKTKKAMLKTKLKTNPKRTQISAQGVHQIQLSSFFTPHTFDAGLEQGNAAGFEIPRMGGMRKNAGKYKITGNEAKEWLKTKAITFLNYAN